MGKHEHDGKCAKWFCAGGARPATGKENREYEATVRSLGGPRSPAGKAFIDREHRKFKESQREHYRRYH